MKERDSDMIESIEMWLHECEPKYVEKELAWLEELRSRLIESEIPKDLEEAARRYGFEEYMRRCNGGEYGTSEDAFIAGAKWQEEQDLKYISEIYRNGYNLCKEQMMKEAVEGTVVDAGFDDHTALVSIPDKRYDEGDRVRIIIVKEDGK